LPARRRRPGRRPVSPGALPSPGHRVVGGVLPAHGEEQLAVGVERARLGRHRRGDRWAVVAGGRAEVHGVGVEFQFGQPRIRPVDRSAAGLQWQRPRGGSCPLGRRMCEAQRIEARVLNPGARDGREHARPECDNQGSPSRHRTRSPPRLCLAQDPATDLSISEISRQYRGRCSPGRRSHGGSAGASRRTVPRGAADARSGWRGKRRVPRAPPPCWRADRRPGGESPPSRTPRGRTPEAPTAWETRRGAASRPAPSRVAAGPRDGRRPGCWC
jgi:hypothetical protein